MRNIYKKHILSLQRLPKPRGFRWVLWAAGTLASVLLLIVVLNMLNARKTQAYWFDDSYQYRQRVVVNNTGSEQAEYQVPITIDTATLISAGKMQSDCDDIRITDMQTNVLNYWIEKNANYDCNSSATKVWVKVPTVLVSDTILYVYYGNATATIFESGTNTFELFDDFNDNNIDTTKWLTGGGGSSTVLEQNSRMELTPASSANLRPYFRSKLEFIDVALDADIQGGLGSGTIYTILVVRFPDSGWGNLAQFFGQKDGIYFAYGGSGTIGKTENLSGTTISAVSGTQAANTVYAVSMGAYGASPNIVTSFTRDGVTTSASSVSYSPTSAVKYVGFYGRESTPSNTFFVDNARVRKFVSPEPTAGSPTSEEKARSPIAYWKFDEAFGTTAKNSIVPAFNGTITGAAWQPPSMCVSNSCLRFDGTDDQVALSNPTELNFAGTQPFSISAWIMLARTPSGSQVILSRFNSGVVGQYAFSVTSTSHLFFLREVSPFNMEGNTTLQPNTWYFVAATYDGTNKRLYVNGKEDAFPQASGSISTNTTNMYIGAMLTSGTPSNFFDGRIDELKVYKYARSTAQIQSDYIRGAGVAGSSAVMGAQNTGFLNDNLVGYWKLDEHGGNATDSSGVNTTLTNNNTTPYTAAKFGRGAEFNGTTQYLGAADNVPLSITGSLTLAAWIEPDDISGSEGILGKWKDTNSPSYGLTKENGNIRMYIDSLSNYATTITSPLAANTKTHVMGVYDATAATVRIYINGELMPTAVTGTIPTSIGDDTDAFNIGTDDTDDFFDGHIDEARVYNRALTNTDAQNLYNWAPGPQLYWNLDEGTAFIANDQSGNAFTGLVNGGTTWRSGKYGNALNFNGSSGYLRNSALNINTGLPFTFSAWIYTRDAVNSDAWMEIASGTSCDGNPQLWIQSGVLRLGRCGNGAGPGLGAASAFVDSWNHIEFAYDGVDTYAYKNGVLTDIYNYSWPSHPAAQVITVGGSRESTPSLFMDGMFDEVKIYSYARNSKQVVEDMNGGHPNVGSPVGSAVGHWKFNEGADNTCSGGANDTCNSGSAGNVLDGAGNNFASPVTAASGWTSSGKYSKALAFDGADDYISIPSNSAVDAASSFSLSAWVNWDSFPASGDDIFRRADTTAGVYILGIQDSGTNLLFRIDIGGTQYKAILPVSQLSTGTWYHIVGVFNDDTNKASLYVNGILRGETTTASATPAVNDSSLFIGGYTSGEYLDGKIDELKFYNYALAESEIKVDYNAGASVNIGTGSNESTLLDAGSGAAPVAEWKFEEGTSATTVDTSGNNLTGTLNNRPAWVDGKYGAAVSFDGGNDYIDVGGTKSLVGARTISAWVKPNATTGLGIPILTGGVTGFGDFFAVAGTTGTCAVGQYELYMDHWGTTCYDSNLALTPDVWNYVAITYTGSSMTFYLNGIAGATISDILFDFDMNTFDIGGNTIGGTTTKASFNGTIDQVRVFDYALTPSQIAYDYNRGAPVAWYKFDECQGSTAYNAAPNPTVVANGTITPSGSGSNTAVGSCGSGTSSEMWNDGTTGKFNSAMGFDDTNDVVIVTDPPNGVLDFGTQDFSLALWIKTTKATRFDPITKVNSGGSPAYYAIYGGTSTDLNFDTGNGGSNSIVTATTTSVNDGNWHHVVGVRTGTTLSLYLDGTLIAQTNKTIRDVSNNGNFCIGYHCVDSARPVNGLMDDVRVYRYALTPPQIKQIYNNGAVFFGPATGSP